MNAIHTPALPDPHVCEKARLSRDARFDGLFYTAVTTTGVYCRPVCPAPPAKAANVRYYADAAAAEVAGFRPCLRCRPELSPGKALWRHGNTVVARALQLIEAGALDEGSLDGLAAHIGVGVRQLRRLFVEQLGAPPIRVHTTRRLLFAKQLLTETALPVTEVALASGFRSLRRFNAAFARANQVQPSGLRRSPRATSGDVLTLRLAYRPPYDFAALLAFLRDRALPGIEQVGAHDYTRVFGPVEAPGWLRVSAWPGGEPALQLQLHCPRTAQLPGVVARVRQLFDLDADPQAIAATLRTDATLRPLLRPGLRLPGCWDGFEIAVRAVLGQQVSVAAARTLAARLVQRWGEPLAQAALPGLDRLFPAPAVLAQADATEIGVTRARAETIRGIARAVLDGRADFERGQALESCVARWTALPGIGEWTAHYIAMRALGHTDAFPAADLVLRRMAAPGETALSTKTLTQLAEAWRPWRAYAVIQLWRKASNPPDRPSKSQASP